MKNIFVKGISLKLFNYSLTLIIVLFVSNSLFSSLRKVDWSEIVISPAKVITGGVLILLGTIISSLVYKGLYKNLGIKLSLSHTLILSTVPVIGKYVPGKVFSLLGHTTIAKMFGIRLAIAGSVALLFVIIGLTSAIALGLLLIASSTHQLPGEQYIQFLAFFFILLIVILILFPNNYWFLLNIVLDRFNKRPVHVQLALIESLKIFIGLFFVNACVIGGSGLAGIGLTETSADLLPEIIGIACLANVIGYVSLFAPGGIGVREGVLYYVLISFMDEPKAALLTIMMRVVHTFSEIVLACIGAVLLLIYKNKMNNKPELK